MWIYLSSLHPLLPYSLVILTIIAIVIISIKGKFMVRWGKTAIGIGGSPVATPPVVQSTIVGPPPPTGNFFVPQTGSFSVPQTGSFSIVPYVEKRRSCEDCLSIIANEYEKFILEKILKTDRILNYQMNFTEEKLIELESDIIELFEKRIDTHTSESASHLVIESKMFYGVLREALYIVKKEIRKSCKENGFCELSDLLFSYYINDKTKVLQTILIRELKKGYPANTLVPIDLIITDVESNYGVFHEYVSSIFTYAKQNIVEEEKEREERELKYRAWVSSFVK